MSEKPHDIADATSWLVNPPSGPTAITTLSGGRVMISIVFEPFGQRISFASVGSDADGPEIKLSSDWNVSILGMRVLPLCSQAAIATLFQWTFFLFNWSLSTLNELLSDLKILISLIPSSVAF